MKWPTQTHNADQRVRLCFVSSNKDPSGKASSTVKKKDIEKNDQNNVNVHKIDIYCTLIIHNFPCE